ncbi:MAG: ParA family protein [Deinococcota bacterium]
MIVTVAGFKGGVGKSTTAIHLAGYLSEDASVTLVDDDLNESALSASESLPYPVIKNTELRKYLSSNSPEHLVIDTAASTDAKRLQRLADECDLLILPTSPDALALRALLKTVKVLDGYDFKVLLTICPPRPSRDADEARELLEANGLPLFKGQIRRAVAFQKAVLEGCLVRDVSDARAMVAWLDYVQIGRELNA